ncbi:MAG: molybdenum cofactor biosynthesis protein MoaE [Granulosicoccus sp.]
MSVLIVETAFDPEAEQRAFTSALPNGQAGATASFIGTMRNRNEGDEVVSMTLEHYPGMTDRELAAIIDEAMQRWRIINALIVHRVGNIQPGDTIVLTVVSAEHRAAAFDACRFLMEALKQRAPFWKKETLSDGSSRWVEKNTTG